MFVPLNAFSKTNVARLLKVKGDVKVIRKNKKVELGKVQKQLFVGDRVMTANKSMARIQFVDGSTIVLGPDSKIEISKFSKDKTGVLRMFHGQLKAVVTKALDEGKKEKLIIKTKQVSMGVRGTEFHVRFDDLKNRTSLLVEEGRVAIAPSGKLESVDDISMALDEGEFVEEGEVISVDGMEMGMVESFDPEEIEEQPLSHPSFRIRLKAPEVEDEEELTPFYLALKKVLARGKREGEFFRVVRASGWK